MLKVISNKTAFELLTMDKEEENNKVYFKEERNNTYVRAVDVVWNFGKYLVCSQGIHFATTVFYEED